MNRETIKKAFESVKLEVQFSKTPLARGVDAEDVFGMDIRRRFGNNSRSEYFLIWPGAEENQFHIAAKDLPRNQLVVTISEPQREFWERIPEMDQREIEKAGLQEYNAKREQRKLVTLKQGSRVGEVTKFGKDGWYIRRRTPKGVRHFLMGRDERQLFMCQLPRAATNVKQAHDSLKSPTVVLAEGKQLGRTLRQGEWFLLNLTPDEEKAVADYLKKTTSCVHRKANVGQYAGRRGGKPHIAEELITIPGPKLEHGWSVRGRDEVFIRGKLSHPDHETIKLGSWRKVILNNEAGNNGGGAGGPQFSGSTWID